MLSFLNKAQEISNEDFDFNRLLQPISLSDFLSKYWEQRPLIISKREYCTNSKTILYLKT
jgi:hypothetical protein